MNVKLKIDMPIISKETWEKLSQEERESILNVYQKDLKTRGSSFWEGCARTFEQIFGKEQLQPTPLTYEDVARELFKGKELYYVDVHSNMKVPISKTRGSLFDFIVMPYNCTSQKQAEKLLAINRMLNVAKFLNKDWKPDWENKEEKKWGLQLWDNNTRIDVVYFEFNDAPVYFRTEELAKQAVQILGEEMVRLALTTDF